MFAPFNLGAHFVQPLLEQLVSGLTVAVVLKNVTVKDRQGYARGLVIEQECYAHPLRNAHVRSMQHVQETVYNSIVIPFCVLSKWVARPKYREPRPGAWL